MISKKHFWVSAYLFLAIALHWNAILKADDPVADTQTEAILYDQKMEQDKDGVKAPATPKMIYYGGQGFLTKNSLSKYETEIAVISGKKKENFNWSDWWEEKPADSITDEPKNTDGDLPLVENQDPLAFTSEDSEPLTEDILPETLDQTAEEETENLPLQDEAEADPADSDWW